MTHEAPRTRAESVTDALYVSLQSDTSPGVLRERLEATRSRQWVYLGEDSAWRVHAEAAVPSEIPRVSVADLLDEMSWKLRQPYIDWIGQLSGFNHSVEWWASALSAKNPYGRLYIRVCLLAVARQLFARGFDRPTLIVCSSPALLQEVVQAASFNGALMRRLPGESGRLSFRRILKGATKYLRGKYWRMRLLAGRTLGKSDPSPELRHKHRLGVLEGQGVRAAAEFAGKDTVLIFTWVDRRSFTAEGVYRDPYFGRLPEMLQKRGFRVAYVPRVLSTMPFEEAVERLIKTGELLFFPEQLVSESERALCQKRAQEFEPTIPENSMVGDVPVYLLAKEHVDETRFALADALIDEPLVANLSAGGVQPREIIYSCEGQAWEQVLVRTVRQRMRDTKVVGYDNVTFSRLTLSMFPASGEYGLRPLPDRIVTNGPFYRDILLSEGFPPEIVESGCGLRHEYLWQESSPLNKRQTRPVRVLVATAIGFGDSVELVAKAALAFGGNAAYEIVVKCHPVIDTGLVREQLGKLAEHDNIEFVEMSIKELLASAHFLLYTYTSVCHEAIQNEVIPICVRPENSLNLDKLEATPDVRWTATSPEDLRTVVEQVLDMSEEERRRWQEEASEVVRSALAPVDQECVSAFVI